MFDLPVDTPTQRRDYRKFVKFLKKEGFIMFQYSIYVKLSMNDSAVKLLSKKVQSNLPKSGTVSMLTVTEKQFSSIEMMMGEFATDIINTTDKVVVL